MACFVVSAAAAVGVATAKYIVRHNEKKADPKKLETKEYKFGSEVKWSKKLAYLELMLWSGSFVLAGEHILHGEVTPYPPFFTAAGEGPEAVREMLTEMGTVGVTMFAILLGVWALGVFLVDLIKYKKHQKKKVLVAEEAK